MCARILIVEDNEPLREMLRHVLTSDGFEVVVAGSGSDALQVALEGPVDAVVTDLDLPGLSGLELCRAILSQTAVFGRYVPVWIMTGSHEAEAAQAIAAGACGVFRKPFRVSEACAVIQCTLAAATNQTRAATNVTMVR